METTTQNPDEFLATLPEEYRTDLIELDRIIVSIFGQNDRVLWQGKFWGGTNQNIIGYGALTYVGSNKKPVDWFMVGLALQKNYISLYISATDEGQYLVKKVGKDFGKVKIGSSSVSFAQLADLDLPVLKEALQKAKAQLDSGWNQAQQKR